jgi:hypothetical protein
MSHSPVRERAHVLAHLVMLLVRCGGGAVDAPSVRSRAVVHRSSLTRRFEQLEQRLDEMERRAHAAEQLADARLHDLERIMPKEFELFHYNVLADQAGTNMLVRREASARPAPSIVNGSAGRAPRVCGSRGSVMAPT